MTRYPIENVKCESPMVKLISNWPCYPEASVSIPSACNPKIAYLDVSSWILTNLLSFPLAIHSSLHNQQCSLVGYQRLNPHACVITWCTVVSHWVSNKLCLPMPIYCFPPYCHLPCYGTSCAWMPIDLIILANCYELVTALWMKQNVSTTPIMAMGCRQCLHISIVQLKGKHCKNPIVIMPWALSGWLQLNGKQFSRLNVKKRSHLPRAQKLVCYVDHRF